MIQNHQEIDHHYLLTQKFLVFMNPTQKGNLSSSINHHSLVFLIFELYIN
jgi:hypothetical protein